MIGWLIDPTQTMHLIEHMSASLVQLQAFWKSDIQFSVMLLGQFTEDLELMLEQVSKLKHCMNQLSAFNL